MKQRAWKVGILPMLLSALWRLNVLENNVKKVYKKASTRIEIFKREAPDVCLPPDPVIA